MSQSQIDLNEIANNSNLSLTITSSSEENPTDAYIRRSKNIISFVVAMLLILSAFSFCGYIILSKNFSADDKKWATTLAGIIVSAFLGFFFGKNIH